MIWQHPETRFDPDDPRNYLGQMLLPDDGAGVGSAGCSAESATRARDRIEYSGAIYHVMNRGDRIISKSSSINRPARTGTQPTTTSLAIKPTETSPGVTRRES